MGVISEATLSVSLLGHPEVRRDGALVSLPTRKTLLLLARMAVEGPQTREVLTALLWPDSDDERGRAALRRTLAYLRDSTGRDIDVVTAQGGSLALGPKVETDLETVRLGLAQASDQIRLAAAVAAWRGAFLEGVEADGEELDEWLGRQRENWHQRLVLACERLVSLRSDSGDVAGALAAVTLWLDRDPLAEKAHSALMRLHLIRGDRAAALEAYQLGVALLRRQLGIEPPIEMQALADRARAGEDRLSSSGQPVRPRPEVPMLGRKREHSALAAAFRRTATGAPELTLLLGEPGIGKTRLAAEFAAWARAQGAIVLSGRAFPSARRLAYQVVSDLVDAADKGGQLPPGGWRDHLTRIVPSLGGAPPAEVDDLRLFDAGAQLLAELAAQAPLLLVIDDLQWVDADSLELFLYVFSALAARGARALFVVTIRDEELAASTALKNWVGGAAHELPLTELTLRPLTTEEAQSLLEMWPEPVVRPSRLIEQAGGRPLLLVESLRFLAAGGDPETIAPAARESMEVRLRSLSGNAGKVAVAAAALERAAPLAILGQVAGIEPGAAEEALDELLERHVLEGEGAYAYTHELLRRGAYLALPHEARRRLHAVVAEVLASQERASPAEVAHHAEMAGDLDLSWRYRLQAGRDAMALPAYRAAVEHYRAAIAIRPAPGQVWLDLGRAHELAGRSDLARDTYQMLVDRARRAGDTLHEAAALVRLGELAGRDLASSPPDHLLEEAADAAAEAGDPALQLEAALAAAQIRAYRGELTRARKDVEAAHRRARSVDRPELLARCVNLRAFVSQTQGRWQEALALARQAARAYGRLGEDLMRLDSIGYEVCALVFLGDWRAALRKVRRALVDAERLGNPWARCNLSLVEGWALREGGQLEAALASAERGIGAGVEAGFLPLEVLNTALAGRCRREMGDLGGALEVHERSLDDARRLGALAQLIFAEELCADHAQAGSWNEAERWAAEAVEMWGEAHMFAHLSLWTVAQARLRAVGQFEPPELPAGERYRLVRLRVTAVMADHLDRRADSEQACREALAIAERLELPVEVRQLTEVLGISSPSASNIL